MTNAITASIAQDDTCDGSPGVCVFTDNCAGFLSCLGGDDLRLRLRWPTPIKN